MRSSVMFGDTRLSHQAAPALQVAQLSSRASRRLRPADAMDGEAALANVGFDAEVFDEDEFDGDDGFDGFGFGLPWFDGAGAQAPDPDIEDDEVPMPVDLSTAIDQTASPLFRLPREMLTNLAGWLGPRVSPGHVGWSSANFFYSCKALAHLSKEVPVRVEFLVGNYGLPDAILGFGFWLEMATPDLFSAIARRARTVPRYLLQRLLRRLDAVGRVDLVPAVAAHLVDTYPPPPAPGGRSVIRGMTDDELFRHIASTGAIPLPYLVREGKANGWAVEGDPVLTALLTLKLRYGVATAVGPGAASSASRKVLGRIRNRRAEWHPDADTIVPGLDANHALLVSLIMEDGDVDKVRRLLALGVHTTAELHRTGWPWDIARSIGLWDPAAPDNRDDGDDPLAGDDPASSAQEGVRRIVRPRTDRPLKDYVPTSAVSGHAMEVALCALHSAYLSYPTVRGELAEHQGRRQTVRKMIFDATEAAVCSRGIEMLRLLLEHEHDTRDRWRTEEGRTCLAKWLKLAENNIEMYKVIQGYAADLEVDRSMDLLAAFVSRDEEKAKAIAAEQVKLSVSQMVRILKDPDLASVHKLAIRLVPLDPVQVEAALHRLLFCLDHDGMDPPPAGQDRHPGATQLLRAYRELWRKRGGRPMLMRLWGFGPAQHKVCCRTLLRPFIEDEEGQPNNRSIQEWDLQEAVRASNVQLARQLLERGVRVKVGASPMGTRTLGAHTSEEMLALVAEFELAEIEVLLRLSVERTAAELARSIIQSHVRRGRRRDDPFILITAIPEAPVDNPEHRNAMIELFRYALDTVPTADECAGMLRGYAAAAGEAWVAVLDEFIAARPGQAAAPADPEIGAADEAPPPQYPSAVLPSVSDSAQRAQ
ncbi:hypothetical protein DFJ74DRAFT_46084 [Hyaloraphidium curvatum]|nr:hypothetical protein DFJ74DRAFT_46084 [Hyaloraphidium curvatum]